jgi:hypothetical protein
LGSGSVERMGTGKLLRLVEKMVGKQRENRGTMEKWWKNGKHGG